MARHEYLGAYLGFTILGIIILTMIGYTIEGIVRDIKSRK